MARISNAERMNNVHQAALREFDNIQSALRDERLQCLQDRRFCSISGAQWEGPLWDQYENKPKFEINKIALAVQRIQSEYRNNRITVDFVSKEGAEYDKLADICDQLYRADEQDSCAEEAYDNAFEEAVTGGFGAWRLRTCYEDEEDDEDERQRIRIEPIFDADSSVFFDLNAKRQDKSDAKCCYVLSSMTRESYIEEYNDDPTTWPKIIHQYEFDWMTPDVVFIAEYYKVEEVSETVRIFRTLDGSEERYTEADFENDETLEETLAAIGTVEVRQKKVKRRKVHKYIMSGGRVLEDCGYIAGKHIPIVPVYGKRWFVDNVERCSGHVRMAKDAQRLKNMQLSKLGEISALSSVEKPILTPEQVAGHQLMWSEDNIKNYPYLLINPITSPDGTMQAGGPVGYTKSPAVPPALAGLLAITEQDMKDVLGNQEQGDKIVSNISGRAVEMVQQRLDMQSFIYLSNMSKAIRRCGEIWLSMGKDVYVEPKRKMKAIGAQGEVNSIELMKPVINDKGEMEYEGDLSDAEFDVSVNVGPSFRSQRASIVSSLTNLVGLTQDPQTQAVLQSMIIMNLDGEGLTDVRDYFRKKLVEMGVLKPTDEELEAMQAAAANAPPDPNAVYLQAAADKAVAEAEKARASVVKTLADAELTQAKTVETLGKAEQQLAGTGTAAPAQQPQQPTKEDLMLPFEIERKELELEGLRADTAMKVAKLAEFDAKMTQTQEERQMTTVLADAVQNMQQMAENLSEMTKSFQASMDAMSKSSKETADKAIEAIKRPKRIIRENGKIVGIETE